MWAPAAEGCCAVPGMRRAAKTRKEWHGSQMTGKPKKLGPFRWRWVTDGAHLAGGAPPTRCRKMCAKWRRSRQTKQYHHRAGERASPGVGPADG